MDDEQMLEAVCLRMYEMFGEDRAGFDAMRDELVKVASGGVSPAITDPEFIAVLRQVGQSTDPADLYDDITDLGNLVWGEPWEQ